MPAHTGAHGARRGMLTLEQLRVAVDEGEIDTVVTVVVVLGFAGIYWAVSAKNWFKGPKVQGTAEELAAIERELSS